MDLNSHRKPLTKRKNKLESELKRIIELIKEFSPEKVILFGSMVRADIIHPHSDIDLIIVKKTDKRFLDRLEEVYKKIEPKCAIDILVYTPEEFSEMLTSSKFIQQAVNSGVVLYERSP